MINISTLPGGIRLVTEQMPSLHSVAVGIWVKTGAVNESPDNAGISHFIEHMMFKGTKNRSAKAIAEDMDKIGGQMNAFTGKEATCYYMKTLSSNMEQGLDILLDMFCESVFDPEEMEREKQVIYEEMKMIQDAPDEMAMDTIGELVFTGSPLGHSIIGTEATLSTIDRAKLTDYHRCQYSKDNIIVSAAGNFDEEKLAAMVVAALADFAEKKEPPVFTPVQETPEFINVKKDIQQAHICLARRTIPITDERVYAHMIVNNIMGGTMSSRLFQHVREQKGLAYSVFSSHSTFSCDGSYTIYAGVAQDKVASAVSAIKEELRKLKEDGVTDAEVAKAKEQIKSSYIFGQESPNSRMVSNGRYAILTGGKLEEDEFLTGVDSVTAEEIKEVADRLGDISSYSGALVSGEETDIKALVQG